MSNPCSVHLPLSSAWQSICSSDVLSTPVPLSGFLSAPLCPKLSICPLTLLNTLPDPRSAPLPLCLPLWLTLYPWRPSVWHSTCTCTSLSYWHSLCPFTPSNLLYVPFSLWPPFCPSTSLVWTFPHLHTHFWPPFSNSSSTFTSFCLLIYPLLPLCLSTPMSDLLSTPLPPTSDLLSAFL